MAIDTIGTNAIANDAVTAAKIPDGAVDADLGAVHSVISVKGTIINSIATTLTIEIGGKFASSVNVKYFEGSTLVATDSSRTVTNGTLTSTVPSAVYGQSVGDTIAIKIESGSSLSANSVDKTVVTAPSGGTITTSGDYRIHTFNSSGTFTIAANSMLRNVEYLVIGGGGGAGYHVSGSYYSDACPGGGAGGYRCSVVGENSGGGLAAEAPIPFMTPGAYNCQVGAGGATGTNTSTFSAAGIASVFGGSTVATASVGNANSAYAFFSGGPNYAQNPIHAGSASLPIMSHGGGGTGNVAFTGNGPYNKGGSGGSGGGAGHGYDGSIDVSLALAGQGFAGGGTNYGTNTQTASGGGGAGGATVTVTNANKGDSASFNGGIGVSSSITGSAVLRGGGGAAGATNSQSASTTGGTGVAGGGNGGNYNGGANGANGAANTGGGGGGSGAASGSSGYGSGNGGSGVIIIRYKLNEVDNFL